MGPPGKGVDRIIVDQRELVGIVFGLRLRGEPGAQVANVALQLLAVDDIDLFADLGSGLLSKLDVLLFAEYVVARLERIAGLPGGTSKKE